MGTGMREKNSHVKKEWTCASQLFPPLDKTARRALELLPDVLAKVWPLKTSHKKSLPGDIADLSRVLTSNRADLGHSYWMKPANISAYLYYFLPWNIIRMARLFRGLDLKLPKNLLQPVLLDAGSGPLSLPIALWLASPHLAAAPLEVLALDSAKKPLELGAKIFRELGKALSLPVWQITICCGPVQSLASHFYAMCKNSSPWLIAAANILNEISQIQRSRQIQYEDDSGDLQGNEKLAQLLSAWDPLFRHDFPPNILFVEPGARLGGDTIMELRHCALENDFAALAPCVHQNPCPLLKRSGHAVSALSSSWCHFTFAADGAPAWLLDLSSQAGLAKQSLSLSPLLLSPDFRRENKNSANFPARVISRSFAVPGRSKSCRYACAANGLCLMENAADSLSGCLVHASKKIPDDVDAKSGAQVIEPSAKSKTRLSPPAGMNG